MTKRRVSFRIEQDEDGYPPYESETLWATEISEESGDLVVDNIPFFESAATIGDVIRGYHRDGQFWFERLVQPSGHSLLRVIVYSPERVAEIRRRLRMLGCSTEEFKDKPLIAVDIPSEIPLRPIRKFLDDLEENDVATYEEAIIRH
jgi:hypothetical protein